MRLAKALYIVCRWGRHNHRRGDNHHLAAEAGQQRRVVGVVLRIGHDAVGQDGRGPVGAEHHSVYDAIECAVGQLQVAMVGQDHGLSQLTATQGKARRATEVALKQFEGRRAELEKAHSDRLGAAQSLGERMTGLMVQIPARAGVDGRLFGSVTNFDIAEAVGKQGFEITKAQVRMPQGPLKSVGDHKVTLALHSDVVVEITVSVLSDAV